MPTTCNAKLTVRILGDIQPKTDATIECSKPAKHRGMHSALWLSPTQQVRLTWTKGARLLLI